MPLRSFRLAWVGWGILWMAAAGPLAAAEQYKVRLARPYKVGYEFNTEATMSYKRVVGGAATSFTGQLYGTVKVLAVNEKTGGITQLQCTVARLTKDGKELYESGVVIVAKRPNHADTLEVTVNGQPAPSESVAVLSPMFALSDPASTISDDQALGTDQPQAVGVAWPINKALAAREVMEDGIVISPATISGESKIVKLRSAAGSDAIVVRSTEAYQIAPHKKPGKAPVLRGSVSGSQELVLPVDTSQPLISLTVDLHVDETILKHGQTTLTDDLHVSRNDQPKK